MAKKRKCRYTQEELTIHEEAVRLRKMTDRQLVEEFHRAAEPETTVRVPDVAQAAPEEADPNENTSAVQKLLNAFQRVNAKALKERPYIRLRNLRRKWG